MNSDPNTVHASLDPAEFDRIVERYEGRLFNFLLRRTGSRTDAEDLTQETFVRAWQQLHRYDPVWSFSTWLFTIAARQAATLHRSRQRRLKLLATRPPQNQPPADPGEDVAVREEAEHIWAIAGRLLKPEQQAGLWLR